MVTSSIYFLKRTTHSDRQISAPMFYGKLQTLTQDAYSFAEGLIGCRNPAIRPNQNPQKPYRIQLALEDKSGNRSPRTISYFIEHDKTKPNFFSINNAKNPRRNTLVDWRQDGAFQSYSDGRGNLPTITNQIDLTLEASTEQLADIEYYLINPRGETKDYQRLINTNNQKHSLNLKLGDKTADRDGQAGLEQDGYYQVLYRSGDSADNETELKTLIVERDTLTPKNANINLSKSGNVNNEYIGEDRHIPCIGEVRHICISISDCSISNFLFFKKKALDSQ